MQLTLAHPDGYDLDHEVISQVEQNCASSGGTLQITNDTDESYSGQHVVYARNWVSEDAFLGGAFRRDEEVEQAMDEQLTGWTCTAQKMRATEDALFLNPMPVDRGREASDEVVSGPRSMIYPVAENRLHVQKAYIALTMNKEFSMKYGPH